MKCHRTQAPNSGLHWSHINPFVYSVLADKQRLTDQNAVWTPYSWFYIACVCFLIFFSFYLLNFTFYKNVLDIRYTICWNLIKIAYFAVSDLGPFCLGKIDILVLATLAWAFIRGSCACAIISNMGVYQGHLLMCRSGSRFCRAWSRSTLFALQAVTSPFTERRIMVWIELAIVDCLLFYFI